MGRLIYQQNTSEDRAFISTNNWESGMYVVEIKDNEKAQQLKLQVIH